MRYNTYGPLSGRVEQSVGLCVYLYGKQKLVIVSDCAYVYDVVTVVHFFAFSSPSSIFFLSPLSYRPWWNKDFLRDL